GPAAGGGVAGELAGGAWWSAASAPVGRISEDTAGWVACGWAAGGAGAAGRAAAGSPAAVALATSGRAAVSASISPPLPKTPPGAAERGGAAAGCSGGRDAG